MPDRLYAVGVTVTGRYVGFRVLVSAADETRAHAAAALEMDTLLGLIGRGEVPAFTVGPVEPVEPVEPVAP